MSSKTKKVIAMTVVLAIMISLYVFLNNGNNSEPVTEEKVSYNLFNTDSSKVLSLTWAIDTLSYSLIKENNCWYNSSDRNYPISYDKVQSLVEEIVKLKGTRKVEGITDYGPYGLEEPYLTINLTYEDGSTQILVGDSTPFSDGTYVMVNNSNKDVYIVSEDIYSILEGVDYESLVFLEEIPTIDTSLATRIQVLSESEIIMDYINKKESTSLYTGHKWYDLQTNEELDDSSVSSLLTSVNSIVFSSFVANINLEDQVTYGFDNSKYIRVYQEDSIIFELQIGVVDNVYYGKQSTSSSVYTISSTLLQSFLEPSDLWNDDLFTMEISDVTEASFVTKDFSTTFEELKDNEETLASIESVLSSIYGKSKTEETGFGEPFLTINIKNVLNVERTFEFYLYDSDNYIVSVSGDTNCYNCSYIVLASSVDKLIRIVHLATV
ncbi:MAG: DUF4340 domain-containing protein [Sphaerochaetaceae bacterium]|nr:DUF4340 domain-containing protein [Sphaerochaetaceae bacterium]